MDLKPVVFIFDRVFAMVLSAVESAFSPVRLSVVTVLPDCFAMMTSRYAFQLN